LIISHPHDFLLRPEAWTTRKTHFADNVQRFRRLWKGEPLTGSTGSGQIAEVQVYPRPLTPEVPLWTATALNEASFVEAGRLGTNVLTALILLNVDQLAERIRLYRETRAQHGHDPAKGKVTVMLHTYLGEDLEEVRETVREPFCQYLRLNIAGIRLAMREFGVGDATAMTKADEEALVQFAFQRYFQESSLCGTLETASAMVQRLSAIGVTEIACLVDFGVPHSIALAGLEKVAGLCKAKLAPSHSYPTVSA
jgi:natural product biosynthesis luciferase-like monooxygenase protein